MPITISIKNVPDRIAELLRRRAAGNHRSLQGELMFILEQAVSGPKPTTPKQLLERIRTRSLSTPSESVKMIREDRDAR